MNVKLLFPTFALNRRSALPFVMPTGAHSVNAQQVHFSKLKENCAEWRHLTHWLCTQLSRLLSYAPDFSTPLHSAQSDKVNAQLCNLSPCALDFSTPQKRLAQIAFLANTRVCQSPGFCFARSDKRTARARFTPLEVTRERLNV
jgi:hypothetical protein